MKEIFAKILYETQKGNDVMLVTLTDNDGSAPRKTGSQMLIGPEGRILGTIGGGAIEYISVNKAQQLISEKRSELHPFMLHTNDREDIGMICGGDVTAHFQFISSDDAVWKTLCSRALEELSSHQGGWFVQQLDGGTPALLDDSLTLLCGEAPECERPAGKTFYTSGNYFWQPLPAAQRVIIFGGGHITAALVPLLAGIGFRSWVFENRPEYVTEERFPEAEKLILGDYTKIAEYVTITDKDYVVIMTNGHTHDLECEDQVLRGPFTYVGVIGSRRKTAAVNARLRELGVTEEAIARVHTPIGTPIKAVTPEEIAVSIAGELILTRAEYREAQDGQHHHCPMEKQ